MMEVLDLHVSEEKLVEHKDVVVVFEELDRCLRERHRTSDWVGQIYDGTDSQFNRLIYVVRLGEVSVDVFYYGMQKLQCVVVDGRLEILDCQFDGTFVCDLGDPDVFVKAVDWLVGNMG